jgi:hypothetical protein
MQKQVKIATNDKPHWKDPTWKYYPACDTDIRRTMRKFAQIVKQQQIRDAGK